MDHLYFVVHTHWDREWYQSFQQMRARLVTMVDRLIENLEHGNIPCFHFDGQTIVLDDYLEVRPENARRLGKLVKGGKLQIGPWYLLADSFLPSGEALIRNLEIGAQLAHRFGKPERIGYLPDQFGHCAQMPQILAGFGLDATVVFRGVGREVAKNRFVWEALDGSHVLAIFLPFGYANGAGFPTQSAEAVTAHAREIAERERGFAAGAPILVMNGNDHAGPDPRLFHWLNEAAVRAQVSAESGTLENYVQKIQALNDADLPLVRGELRSPARSNLTPGVTSTRASLKQRDFENAYVLERLADPLTAMAGLEGRGADLHAYLELAWRTAIQNHAHDSICGCSIDEVHQDMGYRFAQARQLADIVVRKAAGTLIKRPHSAEPAIAVFNPTFTRRALVSADIEIEAPGASYAVIDTEGNRIAATLEGGSSPRTFDFALSVADFRAIIEGADGAEMDGRHVTQFDLRALDANEFALDISLSGGASADIDSREFIGRIAALPEDARLRVHATAPARARVSFIAQNLAQAAFSLYRLTRDGDASADEAAAGPKAGDDAIANEYFRLSPSPRGLAIEDLMSGKRLELYFEDDGDRGDEYNFDPVEGAPPVAAPLKIVARVLERGAARSRLGLSIVLPVPGALSRDRKSRADAKVEISIDFVATLYAGLDRIDLTAAADNRACDHRLRAALSTPIVANESVSDTNFGVVRRPLDSAEPPGRSEQIYPTAPHRTFTAVESPSLSVALLSRGIYETEVRRDPDGATILLTLLRCVGWLSREDLRMRPGDAGPEIETPDAQEQGRHRFEFAISTWRGGYAQSGLIPLSQAYAYPPRAFAADAGSGVPAIHLCECDNPRIVFSTARALPRARACTVRVFSASPEPETARFGFGPDRSARIVDLAGRPDRSTRARRKRDGSLEVTLRPFQIVTFIVRASGAGAT